MKIARPHPHIYQIDTLPWLMEKSLNLKRVMRLINVADDEWDSFRRMGFDYVWLMGIWERSPRSKEIAQQQDWIKEYLSGREKSEEVIVEGSPYSVRSYTTDSRIATSVELKLIRKKLNDLGMGLILDFVPNHTALDHFWVDKYPEIYVGCRKNAAVEDRFDGFVSGDHKIAYGKDPHFHPWTDTAQLDYRSIRTRSLVSEEMMKIASLCDGIRCDMSMLLISDIFNRTWNQIPARTDTVETEFWKGAIEDIRTHYPEHLFLAEAYWDVERELISQGFDFCYDKDFYDSLKSMSGESVHRIVGLMDSERRNHAMRFTENHDEIRSVSAFGRKKSFAAAAAVWTLPGMRFLQQGQEYGFIHRKPVQILVGLKERLDEEAKKFYDMLCRFSDQRVMHEGRFRPLTPLSVSKDDSSASNLCAWYWKLKNTYQMTVINYSETVSFGIIPLELKTRYDSVELTDVVDQSVYRRDAGQINEPGLFVRLDPWQIHLFRFEIKG